MWGIWNAHLKEEVTMQSSRSSAPWIKSELNRDSYLVLDIPLNLKPSFCSVFKCNEIYRIIAAWLESTIQVSQETLEHIKYF